MPAKDSIRVKPETWDRLQALGEGFRGDPLGTPDKVIAMLLDAYEEEHPPPGDQLEHAAADRAGLAADLARALNEHRQNGDLIDPADVELALERLDLEGATR